MKLNFSQMQTRTRKTKQAKARYKKCKSCGSTNLLSIGPDQFCCACDWHTCFEYVDKGYMNNLHYAFREHFPKKKYVKENALSLPRGNSPINSETINPISLDPETKKSA